MDEQYIARRLFAGIKVNSKGRTVQRSSGLTGNEDKKDQEEFESACYPLTFHVQVQAALIEIGRNHLNSKNCLLDSDFDFILQSPLVPPDRREAYFKGITAGFKGDLITSMSILIPQLENSLRELCEQAGIIMTNMNQDMIQSEQSMTDYLYYNEDAIKFLGEDLVFNLRALFADEVGFNFRNLVAHGLVSDDEFYSRTATYIWAFIINLSLQLRRQLHEELYGKGEKKEKG